MLIRGRSVLDLLGGVAGGYCGHVLADAGASVTAVEPDEGDPLRRWSIGTPTTDAPAGALFRFLRQGHGSVRISDLTDALVADAEILIVGNHQPGRWTLDALRAANPGAVILSITPYGRSGPLAHAPSTEFTLQADSGALAARGRPDHDPFQMGGRLGEWLSGIWGAVAAVAAAPGEVIDLSTAEVLNVAGTTYRDLLDDLLGRPEPVGPSRSQETPSIEPTLDGYVGFNTNTPQQFSDFCMMIGRPELADDPAYAAAQARSRRFDEWNDIVHAWTTQHTTAEVVELASLLRIPVAPVCSGRSVVEVDHFVETDTFLADVTGSFLQPRRPWSIAGTAERPPSASAPKLGAGPAPAIRADPRSRGPVADPSRPLAGVRIVDATAWWAGPSCGGVLAALGADVIHVESITRIDGMRLSGGVFASQPQWWERSFFFMSINTNKRGVTLDLRSPQGRDLFLQLVADCDVLIENFTPRVLEGFDLDWPTIEATNPQMVMARMPAFGLSGPWRDRPGFAQTMEQVTGMAWMTGHTDDQPRIPRGPCDPNAGMHAVLAILAAMDNREATGSGCMVEVPMIESALNVAAEQVIEWSAYGHEMHREGNRSPYAAPQNLYRTAPPANSTDENADHWVAIAVETDPQWEALCRVLGDPAWALAGSLTSAAGRRAQHDSIDQHLSAWLAGQDRDDVVAQLRQAGVPAAPLWDARKSSHHPQFRHRGFHEMVEHPVVGASTVVGMPYRFASRDRWNLTPAPTVGQHNHEVLTEIGLSPETIQQLEDDGIIGTWPNGL